MKREIDYHFFSDFLINELEYDESNVMERIAINVLINWDSLFYYGHSPSRLTIQQLESISVTNYENTFSVISLLSKIGLIKREIIKNKKNKSVLVYYSISSKFYSLKNDYISNFEQDWDAVLTWDIFYKQYSQNREIFHQIESFLQLQINEHKVNEELFEKLHGMKNDYILKIAREASYEKRIELKNKVMNKIKKIINN